MYAVTGVCDYQRKTHKISLIALLSSKDKTDKGYVAVNFLCQLIFIFLLFWGMVMYDNEFETKEKQKLTKIKN